MMITVVTVVNKFDVFNPTIKENKFMNMFPVHVYDNTRENIGVSKRYNDFIKNHLQEDAWIVFCHQDFAFQEDVSAKLTALDKDCIYGPIGAGPSRQLVIAIAVSKYGFERSRIGFYKRSKKFGQVIQKTAKKTVTMGQYIKRPTLVDTLDCCCMIVHSSLIKKHDLRFDENLGWHLYTEDFSLNAKYHHRILSKAVQLKCVHLSPGTLGFDFSDKLQYLQKKYRTTAFATTCYDGYKRF